RAVGAPPLTGVPDPPVAGRAASASRLCLARPPRPAELARLPAFFARQLARSRAGELDAAQVAGLGSKDPPPTPLLARTPPSGSGANELAAWTVVARVPLNLDETPTKE